MKQIKKILVILIFIPYWGFGQQQLHDERLSNKLDSLGDYIDSMRHGFKGTVILAVDYNYRPVDSVFVGLIPWTYKGSDTVFARTNFRKMTNKLGFCRLDKFEGTKFKVEGIKGKIMYLEIRSSSGPLWTDSTKTIESNIIQPDFPLPQKKVKKGVRIVPYKESTKK